jgi:hypothetical protein
MDVGHVTHVDQVKREAQQRRQLRSSRCWIRMTDFNRLSPRTGPSRPPGLMTSSSGSVLPVREVFAARSGNVLLRAGVHVGTVEVGPIFLGECTVEVGMADIATPNAGRLNDRGSKRDQPGLGVGQGW